MHHVMDVITFQVGDELSLRGQFAWPIAWAIWGDLKLY
jgi:hypothetical protein